MNERAKILLEMILARETITQQEAAIYFGISERTIRITLDEIDAFLMANHLPALQKQTKTYWQYNGDSDAVRRVLALTSKKNAADFWLEPEYRLHLTYCQILSATNRVTIEQLEKIGQTSRSTVNNDIRKLRVSLAENGLRLEVDPRAGFMVVGDEATLRMRYVTACAYLRRYSASTPLFDEAKQELLRYCVEQLEQGQRRELTYESFLQCFDYLAITVWRLNQGHALNGDTPRQLPRPLQLLEPVFALKFTDSEVTAIQATIRQAHLLKDELIDRGLNLTLDLLASEFALYMSHTLQIAFLQSSTFLKNLTMHLQTVINQHQIPTASPLSAEMMASIQRQYASTYTAVREAVAAIPALAELGFGREEDLCLLTVHVVSGVEQARADVEKRLKVLLVCHLGVGTSQLLRLRLSGVFKFQAQIASAKDVENAVPDAPNYDLVLSTVPLHDTSLTYIKVSPYISAPELTRLGGQINHVIDRRLKENYQNLEEESRSPVLKELLTPRTIKTDVAAADWEDAIRKAGQIMVDANIIQPSYIQQMIDGVREFGPYIVILPGVALAHASATDGVNRIGMSLITLASDVKFGHKSNDPVHTVICLATVDHDTHLRALSELVTLLNDETFQASLSASDKDSIVQSIQTLNQSED
ncbi:BglG family transcription antiterminator [Lacticaseibacillus daqingensis]|uniref:BglG family transcription antiterminator n=1 Tax=Lacticaseibacillus daqingensis TaxID=2486014 RepID=UPI000F7B7320|nr:PTS sugar transporter subunit IIA [Lacticaseibacillus daqingensis]